MVPKRTIITEKLGWHDKEDEQNAAPKKMVSTMVPDNHTMSPKKVWVEAPADEVNEETKTEDPAKGAEATE